MKNRDEYNVSREHMTDGAGCLPGCEACKPEHTPTPWHLSQTGKFIMHSRPGTILNVMTVCECSEEDAAFIVRAVNCHEELVALLKVTRGKLKELMDDSDYCQDYGRLDDIDNAIAKAEGRHA